MTNEVSPGVRSQRFRRVAEWAALAVTVLAAVAVMLALVVDGSDDGSTSSASSQEPKEKRLVADTYLKVLHRRAD